MIPLNVSIGRLPSTNIHTYNLQKKRSGVHCKRQRLAHPFGHRKWLKRNVFASVVHLVFFEAKRDRRRRG